MTYLSAFPNWLQNGNLRNGFVSDSAVAKDARQLLTKYDAQSTKLEELKASNLGWFEQFQASRAENEALRTSLARNDALVFELRTKSQAQASMLEASAQREAALQCALSQAEGELLHASLECLLRPAPPPDQALSTRVTSLERRTEALEARPSTVPMVQATQVASPRWKPSQGQECWLVDAYGQPFSIHWYGHSEPAFARGNVFRTKSEAESAEKKRLVLQKLQDLADASGPVFSTWFAVTWFKEGWIAATNYYPAPGCPRFSSQQACRNAIQVLGPELEVLRP